MGDTEEGREQGKEGVAEAARGGERGRERRRGEARRKERGGEGKRRRASRSSTYWTKYSPGTANNWGLSQQVSPIIS